MDHFANRFESKVSFLPVDLSSLSSHRLIDDLVHQVRPLWIHFGIPCGTASRARQLPLSAKARARGVPQPRPLRSAKFPLGLPDLSPSETARVESANAVYRTCVRALFAAWKSASRTLLARGLGLLWLPLSANSLGIILALGLRIGISSCRMFIFLCVCMEAIVRRRLVSGVLPRSFRPLLWIAMAAIPMLLMAIGCIWALGSLTLLRRPSTLASSVTVWFVQLLRPCNRLFLRTLFAISA